MSGIGINGSAIKWTTLWLAIVGFLGTAAGWVWSASTIASHVNHNTTRVNRIEAIVVEDHDTIQRVEVIVKEIDARLDRMEAR